jgi:hypothetical protein
MTTALTTTAEVRKARPTDAAAVASALAAAFTDDPVFRWILPDDTARPAATRAFFDLVVEILAPHDDTWTTTAGVTGAALWVPAGRAPMSDDRADRFAAELTELCAPHDGRILELVGLMDQLHSHEPHEYLWFVGTPAARGNACVLVDGSPPSPRSRPHCTSWQTRIPRSVTTSCSAASVPISPTPDTTDS